MATAKHEEQTMFDADTKAALKQIIQESIREMLPEILGGLKTGGVSTGVFNLKGLGFKGKGAELNLKDPALQGSEEQKGTKGLKAEVEQILIRGGIDPDMVRYFADLPGYAKVLNNPYSGNLNDSLWLAKKFIAKDGFDERFRPWLKNHPAPQPQQAETSTAPKREHVGGCLDSGFCINYDEPGGCPCWCHQEESPLLEKDRASDEPEPGAMSSAFEPVDD